MDKVQQILALIEPFVQQGKILPRSYQQIADNIDDFICLTQDGVMVACAGLKNCQASNMAEIYALAVSASVQNQGISIKLLNKIMHKAHQANFVKIFAITKHNTEWFLKQGFVQMHIDELPAKRQVLFDHQRNPSIFFRYVD